jgi:hypothetical protein
MEVEDDAGVRSDTFHRLAVGVDRTSSTLKDVRHFLKHGNLSPAHYVLDMAQSRALCRGEAGKI